MRLLKVMIGSSTSIAGLRAVDDEQARRGGIEPALDEIVDQRPHSRGVFRGALDRAERMLVAVRINADRRHQGHVLVHVNAVDLDHHQIEAGKIRRHPFLQPRRRQREFPYVPDEALAREVFANGQNTDAEDVIVNFVRVTFGPFQED